MHKITGTHIEKDIPCYPIFDGGHTRFAGHQHFMFEAAVDEDSQRLYGAKANEGVAFQIGQIR